MQNVILEAATICRENNPDGGEHQFEGVPIMCFMGFSIKFSFHVHVCDS